MQKSEATKQQSPSWPKFFSDSGEVSLLTSNIKIILMWKHQNEAVAAKNLQRLEFCTKSIFSL